MFDFAVLLGDFNMFEAMGKMFFDQRNDLIGAQESRLSGLRVGKKDGAVDFGFSHHREVTGSDKFDHIGGSVPGIKDNAREGDLFKDGLIGEFFGKIKFALKDFEGVPCSGI